jgi:hypothetical protein
MPRREWLAAGFWLTVAGLSAMRTSARPALSTIGQKRSVWPRGSRPGIARRGTLFPTHHETIPSHRFQLALQGEMTSLPQFRRISRLGLVSGCTEGRGLPGQACSYRNGRLKIPELREESRPRLGAGVSLRQYHDRVPGSIPSGMLGRVVTE